MHQARLLQRDTNFSINFHAKRQQISGVVPYSDWHLFVQSEYVAILCHCTTKAICQDICRQQYRSIITTETSVPLNYFPYSVTRQGPGQSEAPCFKTKDVTTCGLIKDNAHLKDTDECWDGISRGKRTQRKADPVPIYSM
jgi:hypothetical protein